MLTGAVVKIDLAEIRKVWAWFLVLGIVLVILGTIAIGSAMALTQVSMVVFGVLLLIAAGMELVQAFQGGPWGGFFLHLLASVLDLVIGIFLIKHSVIAAIDLTLIIAAFLFVGGLFRAVAAAATQFPNWGWSVLSGLISVLLGMAVISRWPADGEWFIGLCIGVDLLFQGWGWIVLSLAARALPEPPAAANP